MRDRPILFSGPMVRAILEGRKTQTRRVVKFQSDQNPGDYASVHPDGSGRGFIAWAPKAVSAEETARQYPGEEGFTCPYGIPGDRLWVKEAIRYVGPFVNGCLELEESRYVADNAPTAADEWPWKLKTLPAMFCPKGLSRLTLEVKAVRVERLQEISEADAIAEGARASDAAVVLQVMDGDATRFSPELSGTARGAYAVLWDSINAKRGHSWESNPWVWVIEFEKVTA